MTGAKRSNSIEDCMVLYLEDCEAFFQSPRTIELKRCHLRMFIRWCKAERIRSIHSVKKGHLEKYRLARAKDKNSNGEFLSKATHRNRLTGVKTFFTRLYDLEVIKTNPAKKFLLPSLSRQLPSDFLSIEEIKALYRYALEYQRYGIRDRAIFEMFFATGVRSSELAGVLITDLDLDEKLLTVHKGKGGHERRVPFGDGTKHWLLRYLREERYKLEKLSSGDALFLCNSGEPYKGHQFSAIVHKCMGRLGINKRGASKLFRHSAATLMLKGGADIRYVQEFLGHADISTTQRYAHVVIGDLIDVYNNTHPSALDDDWE